MSLTLVVNNSVDYSTLLSGDNVYDPNSTFIDFKEEDILETMALFRSIFEDQLQKQLTKVNFYNSIDLLLEEFEKKSCQGDVLSRFFVEGYKQNNFSRLTDLITKTSIPSLRGQNCDYNSFLETFDKYSSLRSI